MVPDADEAAYTVALVVAPLALGYLLGLETAARLATAYLHSEGYARVLQMDWALTVKDLRLVSVGVFTLCCSAALWLDERSE